MYNLLNQFLKNISIHANHHLVVQMQYAKSKTVLVHAHVYQNTLVIHIEDACLNVWLIQTVHKMKLAGEINVKILAQGYVVKMLNVKQLTMCPCVLVPMDILGIRSDIVHLSHHNVIKLFFYEL